MIWLVIPMAREGERGAGQWKDLQGIRLVLGQLGMPWKEFRFNEHNLAELAAQIDEAEATVIWYYTFWPEQMEELKRRCPRVRMVLRTVNAEACQHWLRAKKDWRRMRGLPRDIYGFLRLLWRDRRCCQAADVLASISEWDDAHYWNWLTSRKKIQFVPYVSPWAALLPEVKPVAWEKRENTVACLAGTRDAIGRAHVAGFAALASRPEFAGWRFVLTDGLMDTAQDDFPVRIERIGRILEPFTLLCKIKAVAVLSPWGYGYKTTVADAVAAGCHVLVHPQQFVRLPREEQTVCSSIDPALEPEVRRAADLALVPRPQTAGELQRTQHERSFAAWGKVLQSGLSPT